MNPLRRFLVHCEIFGARLDNGTDAIEIETSAFLKNAFPRSLELVVDGKPFGQPLVGLAVLHPHLQPPRQQVELAGRTTDNLQAGAPFLVPAGAKLSIIIPADAFKRAHDAGQLRFDGLRIEIPGVA